MTAHETAPTAPAGSLAEATRLPVERQLQHLTDRADITDLLDRCLRSLDEGVFDEAWGRAFYTEDATAEMPIGTVRGRDAVVARIREGMALFDRTVHLGGSPVVEIDGDRATARAGQLSTHVLADGSEALFVSGGHAETELLRTPDGWRIAASALRVVWTRGTPPRLPAGMGPATAA
ncbi:MULTISPECIES: nuclear transport factor 2 family protein [unclassified Streptomyces]|uniref:nuclear transport factor 2 family protein n=1 Tax=unclassified Streptomyces TaxID=2593676 RepID=UPI0003755509|nr:MULTISPECIES: nuclear transport factor 2 family protein [unclassified Streptomyces]MYT28732.1 nuclear transport factor 2 family protein [Streptomyces sp. SID8354]